MGVWGLADERNCVLKQKKKRMMHRDLSAYIYIYIYIIIETRGAMVFDICIGSCWLLDRI